jgi:iron complex transport system permease protein
MPTSARAGLIMAVLTALLVAVMLVAVTFGSVTVPIDQVWRSVAAHLIGSTGGSPIQDAIVWQLRMPRVLLGALVGAGLAVSGVAAQALVRNPLADPYVLGISSGASVGAVAVLVTGVGVIDTLAPGLAAFVGALATFVMVYLLARRGGMFAPGRLVLAGIAVANALTGVTSYLVLQGNDPGKTNEVLFWLLGSLAGASWSDLGFPALALLAGIVLLMLRGRALNALLVGDETAASLGVRPARLRRELFAVVSLVTGIMVSLSGGIGFVGLIVPHILRLLIGSEHRRLLPAVALGGAVFMVLVDLLARFALRPQELPVGIVTAVVGAPVFLALMSRRRISETGL